MNNVYENIPLFIKEIEKYEKIAIAGHISPDGDAIASSLSLALALEKMGKKIIILLEDYNDTYNYLKGHNMVYKGELNIIDIELFISVDCGDIDRLGRFKEVFENAKATINIDHHMSNNDFGDINIVNKKASSTAEVVYEILIAMCEIDKDIAMALYTGIVFDTSGFKHNSTSDRTHKIAGELLKLGAENSLIHTKLLYTHTFENARALSRVIENIYTEKDIVISTLSKEEILEDCKATYNDLEGIVGYLVDFKNINIGVLLYEKSDGSIKVSFRSKTIDVNKIAGKFGGGGHILASGATLTDVSLEEAKKLILKEIQNP